MRIDLCFRKILKPVSKDPRILSVFLVVGQTHERLEVLGRLSSGTVTDTAVVKFSGKQLLW